MFLSLGIVHTQNLVSNYLNDNSVSYFIRLISQGENGRPQHGLETE